MKFYAALTLFALASMATAIPNNNRGLDLVFGGGSSPYTNVLAQQIAPLLLKRQPLWNYRAPILPLGAPAPAIVASPQIYAAPFAAQQAQFAQYVHQGPIQAAVHSQRSVHFVDVPSSGAIAPVQTLVIGASIQPLDLEFQSQSSPISVRQVHIPGQANLPQFSSHTDQPDLLKQEIVKPIIHEVTEAIQPFRKITQEVRPVKETINQVIARGQNLQTLSVAPIVAAPVALEAVGPAAPLTVVDKIIEAPLAAEGVIEAGGVIEATPNLVLGGALGGFQGGFTGLNGQLFPVPVNARITRF